MRSEGQFKLIHLRASLALASLLCLGAVPEAIGCGFHPGLEVQLESMHPGSFPVAVALRKAADSGVIDAAALEAPSRRGIVVYGGTVWRLQAFNRALAESAAAAELPASFSLGYVESQLWTRFSQADGMLRIDIHTDGPAEGETVVLTGEPVLTAVLAGKLSVDRALADGLILIEGNDSAKAAIRQVLIETPTANRTSKRSIDGRFIQTTMKE
jgi:hypothetical protein